MSLKNLFKTKIKFFTANNAVFKLPIEMIMQLFSLSINYFKLLENNLSTFGVFIDLSKTFDTVDHTILLKKIELDGLRGNNQN